MLSVRTNPSTLAAGLGALKNEFRKLTDQSVKMSHPMYSVSQHQVTFTKVIDIEENKVEQETQENNWD